MGEGAIFLPDTASQQNIQISIPVIISPLGFTMLQCNVSKNITGKKYTIAIIPVMTDKAFTGQGSHIYQQKIEILIAIGICPGTLRM